MDICIIGGCGRVGLPLAIAFADKGRSVHIYDIDKARIDQILAGVMPFHETGCEDKLPRLVGKTLTAGNDMACLSEAQFIIVTLGTPVEEHLNPVYDGIHKAIKAFLPYFRPGQCIILRSTVYPGTTESLRRFLEENNVNARLAFCPERLAEGKALAELASLPQIVSAFDKPTIEAVSSLFHNLTDEVVVMEPAEAEFAKLATNAWRYITFAAANQLFTIADSHGLDYQRIYNGMTRNYPRAKDLPRPGLAAGPCIFKDTMQLGAFSGNTFSLGFAAMLVNEGMPNYIVQKLKATTSLHDKAVGILGMAFKPNCDDERESLSFKLKRLLQTEAREVYCSDPHIKRDYFVPQEDLLEQSDIIIVATPHDEYRQLNTQKPVVTLWQGQG